MEGLLRFAWIGLTAAVLLLAAGAQAAGRTSSASPVRPASAWLRNGPGDGPVPCLHTIDIRSAYALDKVGDPDAGTGLLGQGQTIVLVDAYGSPTAAQDLQYFHDTFYPALPDPSFEQLFPLGRRTTTTTPRETGSPGPPRRSVRSQEATLDIEVAYAVAPLATSCSLRCRRPRPWVCRDSPT